MKFLEKYARLLKAIGLLAGLVIYGAIGAWAWRLPVSSPFANSPLIASPWTGAALFGFVYLLGAYLLYARR